MGTGRLHVRSFRRTAAVINDKHSEVASVLTVDISLPDVEELHKLVAE